VISRQWRGRLPVSRRPVTYESVCTERQKTAGKINSRSEEMVQASLSDQQTTAQITQKALANRSLFQASWKSLLGFLAVLFGALTASIGALSLPAAVSAALAAGGLAILAFERIADAIDYRTLVTGGSPGTDQGGLQAAVSSLARSAEVLATAARGGSPEHSQDGNPTGGGDFVSARKS
jgi:hypothetical protein